jgi:hypothetical protein
MVAMDSFSSKVFEKCCNSNQLTLEGRKLTVLSRGQNLSVKTGQCVYMLQTLILNKLVS